MISNFLQKLIGELVISKDDGKISMTRLAAVSAHFLAAFFFIYFNFKAGEFQIELWLTYLGFATGHAVWDKHQAVKGKVNSGEAQ